MRRVLLTWRGVELHAYPAMLYAGLVAGLVVSQALATRAGLHGPRVYGATLLLVLCALVGARLLYAALHWERFRREPSRLWHRADGGAALYGGLLLALAASVPVLHVLALPLGAFWDVATFTMLVGMAFTKVGCLLNGCCAGRATTARLALILPDARGVVRRRIPTQLLEAGVALGLIGLAAAVWTRPPFAGAVFLVAAAGYGSLRFLLEATRETVDRVGGVGVNRVISAALTTGAAAVLGGAWWRHAGAWPW